ncbi:MAG: VWA domain-containing protein [Deltaproteobacteria bacterium]|nr:VWA domain-containing protein [Deltaproteobacteria bacterium]
MTTRVQARVGATVPTVIVPIEGATVVEFFGIPLEGAGDIVFVFDTSGSMSELAAGRLAQIQTTPGPPPGPPPPPPVDPGPPGPPPTEPPPDPSIDPSSVPADAAPVAPELAPAPTQPRKIDVAQAELVAALERLPAGTRINVLFFNDELEAFAPNMVPLDDPGRAGMVGFVRETIPVGNTALAPAMRTAFLMNARRIVLLSDGLGNVGGRAHHVLRDAREAIRGGVRIDTIGLGRDQDRQLLQALASESGGLYQPL